MLNQRGFHDQFQAQKKIGQGNFASVYLAQKFEDGKIYAVKAFCKEYAYAQDKGRESLINEIEILRSLNHPNILKLHEVFETNNSIYFILDLIEGGELSDKLESKSKFTYDEIKEIVKGLLEGIKYMHKKNIMHRDLKPENLLLKSSESTHIIIADMGLSTKVDLPQYMFVRCGTPGYVAPEVVNIRDMKTTYSSICDLYSIGIIFHILLLNKSPFDDKSYNKILKKNKEANINFDSMDYLKLSVDSFDLLQKLLAKDPLQRISASESLNHNYFKDSSNPQQLVLQLKQSQQVNIDNSSNKPSSQSLLDSKKEEFKSKLFYFFILLIFFKINRKSSLNSPIQNNKHQINKKIQQDSCLTFKMGNSPLNYNQNKYQNFTNAVNDLNSFQVIGGNESDHNPNNNNNSNQKIKMTPSQFNNQAARNRNISIANQLNQAKSPQQNNNYKQALLNSQLKEQNTYKKMKSYNYKYKYKNQSKSRARNKKNKKMIIENKIYHKNKKFFFICIYLYIYFFDIQKR
ncbi:protein kinase domain protein [Ichthyophthirius multifiliis]|uniref:non-specific serine/threonine protein kinase n=1 Tax=Ichthyophthirius multifiliis TaxID=5932 RepID=G0R363_ICHMU|nr:protein kinase domain protein [Ichthyophthirius multifiliis]EGR28086.1 protein kinase domain protein [Ichthyophthirius multifiliis]|eukprot:XP_004027431.1 protein kinase domain protein [Ichthyophthirius multifiliis]